VADINSLDAKRAIVDNEGKPLPEFLLLWQRVVGMGEGGSFATLATYAVGQQEQAVGLAYSSAIALVQADLAAAGTAVSEVGFVYVTTNGSTWVNGGTETMSGVVAGDLQIFNSGPFMCTALNGETSGDFRIVEDGLTTVFTGSWRAVGDGTYALVTNESVLDTLTFGSARASVGSVTYDLEYRVTSGDDVELLSYLFVRRT
jgi:hypothetical protein